MYISISIPRKPFTDLVKLIQQLIEVTTRHDSRCLLNDLEEHQVLHRLPQSHYPTSITSGALFVDHLGSDPSPSFDTLSTAPWTAQRHFRKDFQGYPTRFYQLQHRPAPAIDQRVLHIESLVGLDSMAAWEGWGVHHSPFSLLFHFFLNLRSVAVAMGDVALLSSCENLA